MNHLHTIGQLAREADVPNSTVRYYERRGLLKPESRSRGNYRLYDAEALDRLLFVRAAQTAGFTLSDIQDLLRFRDGDPAPNEEIQTMINSRLDQVTEQMAQLEHVKRMLRKWFRVCRETQSTGRCGVLEGLAATGKKSRKKPRKPS